MSDYAYQAECEMWDAIASQPDPKPWIVETGVKGAMRINTREYWNEADAIAAAKRWSESNSIGSYWAVVTRDGIDVHRFN
jgi:hypothetical protein